MLHKLTKTLVWLDAEDIPTHFLKLLKEETGTAAHFHQASFLRIKQAK